MKIAAHNVNSGWRPRLRASGIHLGASASVAVLAAALVLGLWYPYPYRELSGGRELFVLVVSVDVVLGPLITLAVFNTQKPWPVLRRDLVVIAALQLAALLYGLWTVSVARPVHLVFEFDRLRVVHAVDVPDVLLKQTPEHINALPWTGPTLLAVRPFASPEEEMDATMTALQGVSLSARPDLWESYDTAQARLVRAARPLSALKQRFAQRSDDIDAAVRDAGASPEQVRFLPLIGRKMVWTALVDATSGKLLATLPLDSF